MSYKSINERVMDIKLNSDEKNVFIEEYKPFIAAAVEKATGRYVSYGYDEELSIGLMAFDEAIVHYDREKGNFLSFAQNIIRRRLIDYYRKEKKHQSVTYISEYTTDEADGEEVFENVVAASEAQEKYYREEINQLRRQELVQLKEELHNWGLEFSEVAKSSPKHTGTKSSYLDIVKYIIDRPELVAKIKQKKYLPIADIEEGIKLPRKTIERSRNYVVAAMIILTGDYYCIREFIDWGWKK
ncbi:MAG: RNA polymerase sigma-I factor [Clostridiaceae bacterium]|nr:RNA polymerase sigma-I factor [Clostridiaceae bacterium]